MTTKLETQTAPYIKPRRVLIEKFVLQHDKMLQMTQTAYAFPFLPRCMECRRGLAMRILSVCPSVTRVNCDKTVERSVQIYTLYERSFSLVL